MSKQYKKEKFESRIECLEWVADNKPVYDRDNRLDDYPRHTKISYLSEGWHDWHKAIEIVPEKRVIEVWVNVCLSGHISIYENEEDAINYKSRFCIGTIKLSKEITIVDGKVVEDE